MNGKSRDITLLEDTYLRIKEMMLNNQLVPGQKIIYRDLAKKLNTSITPVVQTLKRLESANTVKYIPNVGYFVRETSAKEIRELYEAREALELYALPKVMSSITPEDVESIRTEFRKMDLSDSRKLGIQDAKFHLEIIKFCKNDVIYDLLKEIYEQIYLRYKPQFFGIRRPTKAVKEHAELLKALSSKDVKEARRVIKYHIKLQSDHMAHFIESGTASFSPEMHLHRKVQE